MSAQRIRLAIWPDPFLILVALIRRDTYHGAHAGCLADGFHHMHSTHDVGAVCTYGVGVGAANDGLRRQMEDDLRGKFRHRGCKLGVIAHVAANIFNDLAHGCEGEHIRLGAGIEGVTSNMRAQLTEPECEPTALETGMSG